MGSTLDRPDVVQFDIEVTEPDTNEPKDKITRIDIVKDGGIVAQTFNPEPAFSIKWNPTIADPTNKYFFVRVWNAGGSRAPTVKGGNPVAWLAPVWTGR